MPQTQSALRYMLQPRVLKRSSTIAVVVGTLLSVINQTDVVLRGPVTGSLALKLVMNFVIPFVVSAVSAAANRPPAPPSTPEKS